MKKIYIAPSTEVMKIGTMTILAGSDLQVSAPGDETNSEWGSRGQNMNSSSLWDDEEDY